MEIESFSVGRYLCFTSMSMGERNSSGEVLRLQLQVISLRTNLSTQIQRAAQAVTTVQQAQSNFDKQTGVPVSTSAHSTRPDDIDVLHVVSVVCRGELIEIGAAIPNMIEFPYHS